MKNVKYILFDLDGTITDPGEGITNSVAYALLKFDINVEDKATLYDFIGPPLIDSFMKHYGFTKLQAVKAVEYYREYYSVKGIFENKLYDGIIPMLKKLKAYNKKVVLATSKPEKFAIEILKHFGIYDYFTLVAGATMDETRTDKAEVIAYALKSLDIKNTKAVIMIGDRKYDIEGAHINNVNAIGVEYGYGSSEELKEANADYTAKTVKDLESLLLTF